MKKDIDVRLSWGWHPASERMLHVDSVPNGKACGCVCKECGEALEAMQGDVRALHFRHANGQTGETCLHKGGVEALYQRFHDAIEQGETLFFWWECTACGGEHTHNFAEGITRVEREKRAPDSLKRPDISLYREDDLRHLIEVVVTHSPEQSVRDYARERGMSLVVVDMKKDPDLDGTIEAEVLEGSVCPTMPDQGARPIGNALRPGASVANLEEIKELLHVHIDLMEARYGMEFVDHPCIPILEFKGSPVLLRKGQYAVGVVCRRVKRRFTEGVGWGNHVYLRHLPDKRFVLPVVVTEDCDGLWPDEALLARVVLVSYGVNYTTGKPYRRITPLEVDPDTGEIFLGLGMKDSLPHG